MDHKLATIERIDEILVHENADSLEIARIKGWQSIIKKNQFKVGDLVIFIVIDTILPKTDWSQFLVDKNNPDKEIRLKTVRLRGVWSQGLVLPVSILPELGTDIEVGYDVTEVLGVTKYEKPVPMTNSSDVIGNFPFHILHITDEDNLCNYPEVWKEFCAIDPSQWNVTLKLDGTSFTYIHLEGGERYICSRKLRIKPESENIYASIARKYDLENIVPEGYCIQGEIVGPRVQGNPLGLSENKLYVFNVYKIEGNVAALMNVEPFGLETVPPILLKHLPYPECAQLAWWQGIANEQKYQNGKWAEGIVIRPKNPTRSYNTSTGFLSGKIINQNYVD